MTPMMAGSAGASSRRRLIRWVIPPVTYFAERRGAIPHYSWTRVRSRVLHLWIVVHAERDERGGGGRGRRPVARPRTSRGNRSDARPPRRGRPARFSPWARPVSPGNGDWF